MLFADSYFTIKEPSSGIYKDRGSKFLGFAYPVSSEDEIKSIIDQLRKEHHSARHHCYAWRLGADKQRWRVNDDGEPSGTAGKPIFSAIQKNDLTDILIVVVRYFGGTLLGVSGLIQAYRGAAEEAVSNAEVIEKHILYKYRIHFPIELISDVMKNLKDLDATILSQEFDTGYQIEFLIKKKYTGELEEKYLQNYQTQLEFLKLA